MRFTTALGFPALVVSVLLAPAASSAAPLSDSDEAAVYAAAGLQARGSEYYREACATALKPQTERLDINRDGRDEMLLFVASSTCFGPARGGNVALFMRDARGAWIDLFGFLPGVEVLPTGGEHLGYADLGVANPGGCMAVYHWNGSAYSHAANRAIEPGGCQFR
ncbi:hypothetical protein [Methylibium sp.]|jgi:hypothetical protein|uniref:hypothetical protein n=1 Tax=Methylibium sp. TaxID=2067992 RepID=UPI003D0EA068